MKKLEGRARLCLLLVIAMAAGLIYFVVKLEMSGSEWAGFYANEHVFRDGVLKVGRIEDRRGETLLSYSSEGAYYSGEFYERKAVSHLVGDINNSISTAANVRFIPEMVNYNPITGTGGILGHKGGSVRLSIDRKINDLAYGAMGNRYGFVSVYNYKTGDIICLVSTPTVDPADPEGRATARDGAYINKVLSGKFTPGSTFKVLTTAAAIENIPKLSGWTYNCKGTESFDGGKVTCPYVHGKQDIYAVLANSCNCAYAELANTLGSSTMQEYVDKMRLTDSYNINGIKTLAGTFEFDTEAVNLGWAGVGQYKDEVNPLSMMVFMGAIAGNGSTAKPSLIKDKSSGKIRLLASETAVELQKMLRNNVIENYGDENFSGLELHAKSGTAQRDNDNTFDAWFFGYSGDYAFVVCVENGGSGASVAGPVANKVLQAINEK